MTLAISLVVAVLFGLWGYKKGLFAVWPFAFNIIIAVYLGAMLTPMALNMAGEYLTPYLTDSTNITVMFLLTVIYFTIAQFVCFTYFMKTFSVSLPKYVDTFGGAIFACFSGWLIANFILFTVAISPLRDISYTSKYLPAGMEKSSCRHIAGACEFVSACSLQYGDLNICKALKIISRSEYNKPSIPVITKPKPAESAQPKAKPEPKQPQKSVPAESNE